MTASASQTPPDPMNPPPRHGLTAVLRGIAMNGTDERISIRMLLEAMDGRAFGALMLLFALPNVIPTPPGTSAILGVPLVYLTLQMMLGHNPWLPKVIADRSLARKDFVALVMRMNPWLEKAERLTSPRLQFLLNGKMERVIGGICLVLAITLALPIPLGNMLPALAIAIIALGVLERDGLWILGGIITGIISMIVVSGVVYAMFRAAVFVITRTFGL
ncbi:exopolysaccharide biosynthesis protein [Ketogulonicigenium vulgare]|uniref:Uncharacterized ABC-type transport system permease protein n=1 Tax=Ketogulonicigenium vulgare (strain WSH-001) TaxID=759362 RepID=F9Y3F3_KETVW|nr:exopolysaccharide biosynthesis protein [Ketogulonicigenium vulgare]ADO43285.1 exopolysaccharide synthesis, ExoD [Ketogulonicigenium vulgare Y25]AEM41573.1 Uncharacterized ABC-type transport system permease protein [Ketogulonicigenium vulgare WSH-001]ALJ81692.1 ABC transporter permease [Ketogulonicigenium vulgare]ANW34363.1 ABC transporter permease [Ketogulonicigenium vulgare]AOZ55322.1 exopolysaccharide synthesis, ExoD [Ketogulonicigenium vulgare]